MIRRVGILTAGGFAPCLSAALGGLIQRYTELVPEVEIVCYQHGYYGLLADEKIVVTPQGRQQAHLLHRFGGSPIGNSRVKLTNNEDLRKRGLIPQSSDGLTFAAERLRADEIDVLHTIGGDDTNTTAADLAAYLEEHDYHLVVVGLPKTIDNDVIPIRQSLGAWTAAEEGAHFGANIVGEHRSGNRMLIVHEIMGRHCGWLAAATAAAYRRWLASQEWAPALGLSRERWDIHGLYLPELPLDIEAEAARLRAIMDEIGNVNIFLSEGAGMSEIVAQLEAAGEVVQRDPFGHVKLDTINPGQWFAKQFAAKIGAEKTMVQKSGYYSRAAAAHSDDLRLIQSMTDYAVECALRGEAGVIGHDEEDGGKLKAIAFSRIAGGKAFDIRASWFQAMLADIGQPVTAP